MRNSIEIDFASINIVDTEVKFSYYPDVTSNATVTVTEVAKALRAAANQFTIGANITNTSANYAAAIALDYPSPTFPLTVSVSGSKVTITTTNGSPIFNHPMTGLKIGYRVKTGSSYVINFDFLSNPEDGFTTPYNITIPKLANYNLVARFKLIPTQLFDTLRGATTANTVLNMRQMAVNYYPVQAPNIINYMSFLTSSTDFNLEINYLQRVQVGLVINTLPVAGTSITFNLMRNNGILKTITKIFSATVNDATHVIIGSTILATTANFVINLRTFDMLSDTEYNVIGTNTVGVIFTGAVHELWRLNITANTTTLTAAPYEELIDADITNIITIPNDIIINNTNTIKVRGSELYTTTETNFDKTQFKIYTWTGSIFDAPDDPYIIVNKSKIRADQVKIFLNVSPYIKPGMKANVINFIFNSTTNAFLTVPEETKWAKIVATNTLSTDPEINQVHEKYYYALDGYLDMLDIYQNQNTNILLTGDKRYVEKNSIHNIFFKTLNLVGITYTTSINSTPQIVGISGGVPNDNTYFVKGVKVKTDIDNVEWIKYTFEYELDIFEITYYLYEACNSDGWELVFKNRHGMLEGFPVTQRTTKRIETTGTEYLRNIVDLNGDYDISQHTKKQYNVTGKDIIVFNTDWLPEYMNIPLKELMMTEELYLIDKDNNAYPVIKTDESVNFKTQRYEKLIQYTISVNLSHETMFNIQ